MNVNCPLLDFSVYRDTLLRAPRRNSSSAPCTPRVFLAGIRNKTEHFSVVFMLRMPKNPLSGRYRRRRRRRRETVENTPCRHAVPGGRIYNLCTCADAAARRAEFQHASREILVQ